MKLLIRKGIINESFASVFSTLKTIINGRLFLNIESFC